MLTKTKTCAEWSKRRRCKYILNLFLGIWKYKMFFDNITPLPLLYVCSDVCLVSVTRFNWLSTSVFGYPLFRNQALKLSRWFSKAKLEEHNLLMRKPWLNTIDFFIWMGCAELKSRNWWQSVSLQYKSVSRCWSIKLTFTSKKLTDFLDFSLVNFKFGWKLVTFSKNSSTFSSLYMYI